MCDQAKLDLAYLEWAQEYGLRNEPNYSSKTEFDCAAAFRAGVEWNKRTTEAQQPAQGVSANAVPDGWKLVPIEPTEEMLDAAVSHALSVRLSNKYNWTKYMTDVWARMLSAPQPVTEKG